MEERRRCNRETETYSRVVGFYSATKLWNKGKKEEWKSRKEYKVNELEVKPEERK